MGQGGSPGADNAAAQNVDDAAASFGTQPEFGDTIRNTHAASSSAQGDSRVSVMSLNSSPLGSAGTNAFGGHDPNAKQASTLAATGGSIGDRVPQMPQDAAAQRPKAVGEALFNGLTGFMGMPGLTPQRDSNGNYDEGLGFHQDGTVRRADGNSGDQLTADGRRANAYAQSGLDGAYTNRAQTPDYDPQKWYDPHSGSQRAGNGNGYGGLSSGLGGYGGMGRDFDPARAALDRGLSYGLGLANAAGEAALSSLMDGGRARLNFSIDWDGNVNGEGDVLFPFYDSQYTTIYTQIGARTMNDEDTDTRWIGNLGLGQRWFPAARSLADSGDWMFGYNAFYDYDFTRNHQRGGVGVEAQYDWLRLASNYYVPLSGWRDSEDFDGDFVQERAAEGWDVRLKGYLPFYRNVALTGSYGQWMGDHVGMFGSERLEEDPRVWSYGLEYTPVPLVSGFLTQRQTERGRTDTEAGLRFTYHFQMPWEDQLSHDKVAELRTVSGSRHEFVDRENRIILEYKGKNSYHIELVSFDGNNFVFRIRNGFDEYVDGVLVRVFASGNAVLASAAPERTPGLFAQAGSFLAGLFSVREAHAQEISQTYTSGGGGFVHGSIGGVSGPATLTVQAGGNTQTFTVNVTGGGDNYGLTAASSTLANSASTTLTLTGPANSAVTWSMVSGPGALSAQTSPTSAAGLATATLTAAASGSGPMVVKAEVDGVAYTCTVSIGVSYTLEFGTTSGGGDFVSGTSTTATIPVTLKQNGVAYATVTQVTWSIVSADNSANAAVVSTYTTLATGLAWGAAATTAPGTPLSTTTTSNSDASGNALIQLTDILGERTVTVRASVTVGGSTYTADQDVTFGRGPLSVLKVPTSGSVGSGDWDAAYLACNETAYAGDHSTGWTGYVGGPKMPVSSELVAVSGGSGRPGAYLAAGWPVGVYYWTGEAAGANFAFVVFVDNGNNHGVGYVGGVLSFVCRR